MMFASTLARRAIDIQSQWMKPTVRQQDGFVAIVGDVSALDPAQALMLARELLAAAVAVMDEDMEELKDQLQLHEAVLCRRLKLL